MNGSSFAVNVMPQPNGSRNINIRLVLQAVDHAA
jgi:hypothetical protein